MDMQIQYNFIVHCKMLKEVDEIIGMCQQGRELSNSELKTMLLNLALNFKNLILTLQSNGIMQPQSHQNLPQQHTHNPSAQMDDQGRNKMFYDVNQELLKPNPGQHHNQGNQHNHSKIQHPVSLAYVNRLRHWWPPQKIAACIGVPGYASETIYNHFALSFWTYRNGPVDAASVWANPTNFFGAESPFGSTTEQIQKTIKQKYNEKGIKILVSTFGSTQFPTTSNFDPLDCARRLGKFVGENNLDGVDIDWQDNTAMEAGTGEGWIIKFQTELRKILPNHIITHAPQAPYFKRTHYKNGAYVTVNNEVGHSIDFYNVQFYNQGDTKYNTYQTLFCKSGSYFPGTSVRQIAESGVPLNKIIVGKPASQQDVYNSGLVDHDDLGKWVMRANEEFNWFGGVMYWQYDSDLDGKFIEKSCGRLRNKMGKNHHK